MSDASPVPRTMADSPTASGDPDAGAQPPACPWAPLDPAGSTLSVHDFLTTMFSQTSNGLRRTITLPYAGRHGLTLAQWRVLSVLAPAGEMPFTELVELAATDKAQVSRTLQTLAARGLVRTEALGAARRHGMVCHMTPAGQALVEVVMPEACRAQAAMLLTLSDEERRVLYAVLTRLRANCASGDGLPDDGAPD
ncbi:MAG: MarR family winged helix-turn-helix transcriptional regulator [Rhodoferax sp.]